MELTFCHGRNSRKIFIEDITDTVHIDKDPDCEPDIVSDFFSQKFIDNYKYGSVKKMRFIGCPLFHFGDKRFRNLLSLLDNGGEVILYGMFGKGLREKIYIEGFNLKNNMTLWDFFKAIRSLFETYGYIFSMDYIADPKGRDDRVIYSLLRKEFLKKRKR